MMRRRGVVLVFVLWAVVVLTVVCLALAGTARYRQAHALRDTRHVTGVESLASARSLARRVVLEDDPAADTLDEPWSGDAAGDFRFEISARSVSVRTDGPAPARWGLTDEAARLNANTATAEMLSRLPNMTLAAAEAFVAAREAAPAGRASGTTGPLATPQHVLDALAEAFVASGLGLGGEPVETPETWADATGYGPAVRAVEQYLTVYSRRPNTDAEGAPRVNVNTAPPEALTARLGDALSEDQLAALVLERAEAPFETIGGLLTREMSLPPEGDEEEPRPVRIERPEFRRIADRITVTDAALLVGRVNVNTAPAEVLAAVPGLTEAHAASLVDARPAAEARRSIAWTLDVLDDETFAAACEHLTTRTNQFRMYARSDTSEPEGGSIDGGGSLSAPGSARALAVLERGDDRCGVIFWLRW